MGELVDLIFATGFGEGRKSGDVLGGVCEYFLGQFASAEGKKGGMFAQSERFVESHSGRRDGISIYGQESNPTTWRLAAMNLAIRWFAADLGQELADTFARDQHPGQKFDYILANPSSRSRTGAARDTTAISAGPLGVHLPAMPTTPGYNTCSGNFALAVKQA